MPPKWQSPLLSPSLASSSSNNQSSGDNSNDHSDTSLSAVTTPRSGIYALCFGHPNAPFESKLSMPDTAEQDQSSSSKQSETKKRKLQSHPTADNNTECISYCGCECRADFITNGDCSEGKSSNDDDARQQCISVSLPFPTGKDNAMEAIVANNNNAKEGNDGPSKSTEKSIQHHRQLTILTSTRIGRAIYLPEGTRVRAVTTKSSPGCCRDIEAAAKLDTSASSASSCQLKWRLVLHRELTRDEKDDGASGIPTSSNNLECINLNPAQTKNKHLVCAECGKKYPSVKAVRAHYMSVHVSSALSGDTDADAGASSLPAAIYDQPMTLRRPLEVVYNDEALAVVIKPQGISVMGGRPSLASSDLFMALKEPHSCRDTILSKPVAVHRLDSPTGGLLVVAKTKDAEVELKKCFASRSCRKRYRAIVFGRLNAAGNNADGENDDTSMLPSGVIKTPVDGKPSQTNWQVVSYTKCSEPAAKGWITTVDLCPLSGRKHQLRKHMQSISHPIWGDKAYGPYAKENGDGLRNNEKRRKFADASTFICTDDVMLSNADTTKLTVAEYPHARLCLYAVEITFPHPVSKQEITVKMMDEPYWYQELRNNLQRT